MLSAAQIAEFHRDGFLIIRGLIAGPELELLKQEVEQTRATAESGGAGKHSFSRKPDGRNVYYRTDDLLSSNLALQQIAVNPLLLACVGQCLGHAFLPINDAVVYKLPGGDVPVTWHQDPPYGRGGRTETSDTPNFIADIYLDRSTPANGGVYGLPARHLAGRVDLPSYTQDELFAHPEAVPLEMNPGDVLFHCPSSPHGSRGNTSDLTRRIYYIHYLASEIIASDYPNWIPRYQERVELCQHAMVRRGGSAHPNVQLTERGFEFSGQPGTPPFHWRSLKEEMSEQQKECIRTLRPLTVAR